MSINTMRQMLEAIQDLRGYRPDIDKAIEALRTAIQQAESEPCKSFTELRERHREGVDAELAEMEAENNPSQTHGMNLGERIKHVGGVVAYDGRVIFGSPMAVDALILQVLRDTHPAPGVPDEVVRDAERYRWLRASTFPKADQYPYRISTKPIRLPIGFDDQSTFDAAIDAAMIAAQYRA